MINKKRILLGVIAITFLAFPLLSKAQNKQLTFKDIMKWNDISRPVISNNGQWLAYNVWPDRGDGKVQVRNVGGETLYTIALGKHPRISNNSQWVGAYIEPRLIEQIKYKKDKPKRGLALLNTANGNIIKIDSVRSYQFSNNGQWVAAQIYESKRDKKQAKKNKYLGSELV